MRRLEFRVASIWRHRPVERGKCEASVVMKVRNKRTGVDVWIQKTLKLENDGVQPYLAIPCNCVHIIEPAGGHDSDAPKSPLAGLSHADMVKKGVKICVVFHGWDTGLEREVYSRWRYTPTKSEPSNIVFGHHFVPMHMVKDDTVEVDLARLHRIVKDNEEDLEQAY